MVPAEALGEIREATADLASKPTIAVTGCVAQQEGESLRKRDGAIDVIVGTQSLKELPRLLGEAVADHRPRIDINPHEDVSFPLGIVRHDRTFSVILLHAAVLLTAGVPVRARRQTSRSRSR